MKRFNLKLSLAIDQIHAIMQRTYLLPNTPLKIRKLLILRKKLTVLERRIKA